MLMKTFSERLTYCREAAGYSQSEFARRLSITPQAVQKWEKGENAPRGKRLEAIAELLHTSINFLLTGEGSNIQTVNRLTTKLAPVI